MPEVHIPTREVKRVLANLNIKKSSGPDENWKNSSTGVHFFGESEVVALDISKAFD